MAKFWTDFFDRSKQFILELGGADSSALLGGAYPQEILKSVRPFLDDALAQLKETGHFGVLGRLLEKDSEQHSHLDYVIGQCLLLYELKHTAIGLGLGSNNNFPPPEKADQWKPLRGLSGLDIVQAWTVLVNAGHLFGTFATERSLLFELDKNLPLRDEFVSAVCAFDNAQGKPLKSHVQLMLDRARLHSFHGVLALWRLRSGGATKLPDRDCFRAQLLVKAFLLPPNEKIRALLDLFRRVRQLTYLQLHSALANRPIWLSAPSRADLLSLFPEDALPDADWVAAARWELFDAVNHYDNETLFSTSDAASEILAHIGECRQWWLSSKQTAVERIDALFRRPKDWPSLARRDLQHFVELRIPSSLGWLHEVRHWLRDDNQADPWQGADFFISPLVSEPVLRLDIYGAAEGLPASVLRHVFLQLARPFASPPEAKHMQSLWMSGARLGARAFETLLGQGNYLRLRPAPASAGHIGYATIGATYEFVRGRVKGFLPNVMDHQRSKELRQLLAVADEVVGWRNPTMIILARAEISSRLSPKKEALTEVDGLLAFFRGNDLFWLIVETKKDGSQDGGRQLVEKFAPTLAPNTPVTVEERSYGTERAWFAIIQSPRLLNAANALHPAGALVAPGAELLA